VAGLGLNVGGWGSAGAGTYVPAAANQPGGATIGTTAFGIASAQTEGPATGPFGAVLAGAAAAVLLVLMWQSLPR